MRVLVIGAGALGGYFGARLAEAGRDVTFLVRPRRAAELGNGLLVTSPAGNITISGPQVVTADRLGTGFDLILLGCKAYDLDAAVDAFAPAVRPQTLILPLLNGMRHMDVLNARFGQQRVLGGQCVISATLDGEGRILHVNDLHSLTFGDQRGDRPDVTDPILAVFSGATFAPHASPVILQDMWEKWVFIATVAGMTCLMRASIGDIASAGYADVSVAMMSECAGIAAANGFALRPAALKRVRTMLRATDTPLMASMLRDIERGAKVEADHILGDLLQRGENVSGSVSLLKTAYAHLKAYEARKQREQAGGRGILNAASAGCLAESAALK